MTADFGGITSNSSLVDYIESELIWGIIEPEYMTPPPMGAETVYTIVKNETLRSMWLRELKLVMGNIKVRDALEAYKKYNENILKFIYHNLFY